MSLWIKDTPSTAKHANQIDIFTLPGYKLKTIFQVHCLVELGLFVVLI